MDGLSLAELLPVALGIGLNPPAIVAVILMLSTRRAGAALSFLAGWVFGLGAVGAFLMVVGESSGVLERTPSVPALVMRVVLGVALLVIAVRYWRATPDDDADSPAWLRKLSELSATKAFGAATLYAALNPKTLALNAAGVLLILGQGPGGTAAWIWLLAFVLISSLTVAAPLVVYFALPKRATAWLSATETWLLNHSTAIASAVLLVLGVMLVSGGVQGLLDA